MLSEELVAFLSNPVVGYLGTRNGEKFPEAHRVYGWRPSQDRRSLTLCIPTQLVGNMISHLNDNGQVAVTVVDMMTNDAYQLKGKASAWGEADPQELEVYRSFKTSFFAALELKFGEGINALKSAVGEPITAVTFEVREIYVQTPGPGAGKQIYPEGA